MTKTSRRVLIGPEIFSAWVERISRSKNSSKSIICFSGAFEISKAIEKQIYKHNLPAKWWIDSLFHRSFLEKSITRKKRVDLKIADQLEFEKNKQMEQNLNLVIDKMLLSRRLLMIKHFGSIISIIEKK